ncbi:hypothetical protein ACWGS9_23310 [Bradyrhizobium sp. Arg314]
MPLDAVSIRPVCVRDRSEEAAGGQSERNLLEKENKRLKHLVAKRLRKQNAELSKGWKWTNTSWTAVDWANFGIM